MTTDAFIWSIKRLPALLFLCLLATGCGVNSDFATYFVPESLDVEYPEVEDARVMQVGVKNPEEIRRQLLPDAILVGSSEFRGTAQSESALEDFAKSIGADVVIWYSRWMDTITTTGYHHFTDYETHPMYYRYRCGRRGYGYVTMMTDRVEPYTITTEYFEHAAIFLRTKKAVEREKKRD